MLKDIYSPLEIDDQWDQRAPVHEDKAEGGNADGMSTTTPEVPVENPSGGVAVMDQPTAESTPAPVDPESAPVSEAQEAPTVDPSQAPTMDSEVPGMQTPPDMTQAPVEAPNEITQFHPSDSSESTTPVTMEESTTEQTPTTDEVAPAEATGTETPDQDNDDDAASILSGTEHDVPASPFDSMQESNDVSADSSAADETSEPTTAMPVTTVEPDADHRPEVTDDADIRAIVDRPLTDEENEIIANEKDQLPVSASESESKTGDDEVSAEVRRGMEKVRKAIDAELEALANRKTRLEEALAKHEQERNDADAQATATQAQIDQVESAISELESKK